MADVTLSKVCCKYPGGITAVADLSLHINDKELLVILGHNGCGKTTVLRTIAGLQKPLTGTIKIDGKVMNKIHPKDRDIAMIFEINVLYPHLTVYENLAFALKTRKVSKVIIDQRIKNTADLLGLGALLKNYPEQLSTFETELASLARAVVRQPKVMLIDDPLIRLETEQQHKIRNAISKVHKETSLTIVYATQDPSTALSLADRIALMNKGTLIRTAAPDTMMQDSSDPLISKIMAGARKL